jgi:predicted ATP-grasp superfamily ATP-dependent carboligase
MNPAAIVTDASERVGLHVIRSLGRQQVPVRAVELEGRARRVVGFSSRYTTHSCLVPHWDEAEGDWLAGMLEAGEPGDVLLPSCLNAMVRVLKHRERLAARYKLLLPDSASLTIANDKWRLSELCREAGIETPRTWQPGRDEVAGIAEDLSYPVVVKLRHDENLYGQVDQRYHIAHDAAALIEHWKQFHAVQELPVIQEYVEGDGFGFEALYDAEGQLAAGFCHHRLMEYPTAGGPSAVCESVKVPELEKTGREVLERLSWRGVAMVEFKRCAQTGKFYLLEINPRFWGSLTLSEAAGVNFPHLLYKAALGETMPRPDYRVGVRMRLLPTYLLSLASHFKASPLAVGEWLPKLGYLLDPRVCEGLFALDDLKPAFAYVRTHTGRS